MLPLHDHQHLALADPMQLVIGLAEVREQRQLLGIGVEEDGIVRSNQPAILTHQNRPRVLLNQLPDDLQVVTPLLNYLCGRAMRRWSRASSSTAGSTPCSRATSRSDRPDSAAVLTMSAARS